MKRNTYKLLIGLLVISLFLISGCGNTNSPTTTNEQNAQVNEPICYDKEIPYEEQEEYVKTEYYTESVPYTDKECETKDIAYSVDNTVFDYNTCNKEEDLCVKYFAGFCTEKKTYCVDRTISCSLDLRNLDMEEPGYWTIQHRFYDNNNQVIKSVEISQYLYPQTTQKVTGQVKITSQGENGDANKNINYCGYSATKIPTKQVCRDVIKYKDIQRSREVTAYRPVTKYKTEKVCE